LGHPRNKQSKKSGWSKGVRLHLWTCVSVMGMLESPASPGIGEL
jgi:hypothetical protein